MAEPALRAPGALVEFRVSELEHEVNRSALVKLLFPQRQTVVAPSRLDQRPPALTALAEQFNAVSEESNSAVCCSFVDDSLREFAEIDTQLEATVEHESSGKVIDAPSMDALSYYEVVDAVRSQRRHNLELRDSSSAAYFDGGGNDGERLTAVSVGLETKEDWKSTVALRAEEDSKTLRLMQLVRDRSRGTSRLFVMVQRKHSLADLFRMAFIFRDDPSCLDFFVERMLLVARRWDDIVVRGETMMSRDRGWIDSDAEDRISTAGGYSRTMAMVTGGLWSFTSEFNSSKNANDVQYRESISVRQDERVNEIDLNDTDRDAAGFSSGIRSSPKPESQVEEEMLSANDEVKPINAEFARDHSNVDKEPYQADVDNKSDVSRVSKNPKMKLSMFDTLTERLEILLSPAECIVNQPEIKIASVPESRTTQISGVESIVKEWARQAKTTANAQTFDNLRARISEWSSAALEVIQCSLLEELREEAVQDLEYLRVASLFCSQNSMTTRRRRNALALMLESDVAVTSTLGELGLILTRLMNVHRRIVNVLWFDTIKRGIVPSASSRVVSVFIEAFIQGWSRLETKQWSTCKESMMSAKTVSEVMDAVVNYVIAVETALKLANALDRVLNVIEHLLSNGTSIETFDTAARFLKVAYEQNRQTRLYFHFP